MTAHTDTQHGQPREIFFSYKREDAKFVQSIYEELLARGVRPIWMDLHNLDPGDEWLPESTDAVNACTHTVVFISPLALVSKQVRYEYELADSCGKVIIPIIIDESLSRQDLPPLLRKHQILSMTQHDDRDSQLAKLARKLPQYEFIVPHSVRVEAGPFLMGRPGEEHSIELPEFWIGRMVVTVSEYARFVRAGGLRRLSYWPAGVTTEWLGSYGHSTYWPAAEADFEDFALLHPRQPMRGLTWVQAYAYCEWLNYVTGQPATFHLPTEAQWEKAARGTDGRTYPWGNAWLTNLANTQEVGRGRPVDCGELGTAGQSPYGCLDMAGNVWEWTSSRPLPPPYIDDGTHERARYPTREPRVIRGGSWMSVRSDARTYSWASEDPIPKLYRTEIGLRIAAVHNPGEVESTCTATVGD